MQMYSSAKANANANPDPDPDLEARRCRLLQRGRGDTQVVDPEGLARDAAGKRDE